MAPVVAGSCSTVPDVACRSQEYVRFLFTFSLGLYANTCQDREDATKESDFTFDDEGDDIDEDNDWDGEIEWADHDETEAPFDGDVADEGAAYLDFLNKEVSKPSSTETPPFILTMF